MYRTWSTGRSIGDGWPDTSNDNENKDWSVASTAAAYTDLVQEFEPGKPWKVTVGVRIYSITYPSRSLFLRVLRSKVLKMIPA